VWNGLIQVVSDVSGCGSPVLGNEGKGMEGIVSKHMSSPYIGGKKHREWLMTKNKKRGFHALFVGVKLKVRKSNP
jgi:ATP-dependent DNA ligase